MLQRSQHNPWYIDYLSNSSIGYFKAPSKNKEAFDADRWLHSGDIGVILPNGALKIMDRIKNIFKLAQGEYIAPEKLENVFTKSPLIAQIFIYGDSLQPVLVAIIVPDEEAVTKWAANNGEEIGDYATFINTEKFHQVLMADMHKLGKEQKVSLYGLLKDIF